MPTTSPVEVAITALGSVKAVQLVCGVSHTAVWLWRRQPGGRIPTKHLAKVFEACKCKGVTAEELITGKHIVDDKTN